MGKNHNLNHNIKILLLHSMAIIYHNLVWTHVGLERKEPERNTYFLGSARLLGGILID